MKLASLDQIPPIIKLRSKGTPSNTCGHTIKEATNKSRRNVHPAASNYNLCEWILFNNFTRLSKELMRVATSEAYNSLTTFLLYESNYKPFTRKQVMHIRYYVKTPCKNSPLDCYQRSHNHLVIQQLCDPVSHILSIDAPQVWSSGPDGGTSSWGVGAEFELLTCLNKA